LKGALHMRSFEKDIRETAPRPRATCFAHRGVTGASEGWENSYSRHSSNSTRAGSARRPKKQLPALRLALIPFLVRALLLIQIFTPPSAPKWPNRERSLELGRCPRVSPLERRGSLLSEGVKAIFRFIPFTNISAPRAARSRRMNARTSTKEVLFFGAI
jgi:hypothetical protein